MNWDVTNEKGKSARKKESPFVQKIFLFLREKPDVIIHLFTRNYSEPNLRCVILPMSHVPYTLLSCLSMQRDAPMEYYVLSLYGSHHMKFV